MRILLIGDIVGRPGVDIVVETVPGLRRRESLDLVVANCENADDGSGVTPAIYRKLRRAGVDCLTSGDHIYRKRDIIELLNTERDILRPANYPPEAPGRGWTIVPTDRGAPVAVLNLIGRVFMKPVDCPFRAAEQALEQIGPGVLVRIVDFHAEATSDKQLMGRFLDGRVSAVLGTHTHVTTDDASILPGGTAFQCDVGMTGPHDGILGRQYGKVLASTVNFEPTIMHVATSDVRISGTIVDIDQTTGRALSIRKMKIDEQAAEELAERD